MKRYVTFSLVLALTLAPLVARAGTATITVTKTNTPTVPATSYRLEEQTGSTWGNLQGATGPTTIPAAQNKFTVSNLAAGSSHRYSVVVVGDNGDGMRSNAVTASFVLPDEQISISVTTSPQ